MTTHKGSPHSCPTCFEHWTPTKEEMVRLLEESLEAVKGCDSRSDFDPELGRWQLFLSKAAPIYDKNGSL